MDDRAAKLHGEILKGQAQFAYFQLGLAASAIAFAIHETDGQSLDQTPWPVGAAVASWALSFALGCFGVEARQRALTTNANYLIAVNQTHPAYRQVPDVAQAIEQAKEVTQKEVNRPLVRFRWQLWTLFGGALFYIWGHLLEMAALP